MQTLLGVAKRPVILMGGINWTEAGRDALQNFAEVSDIPVVAAFRYQDQFDNFSPSFVGEAGVGMLPHVKALIRDADLILIASHVPDFGNYFIGATADRVVRHSKCSVLVDR